MPGAHLKTAPDLRGGLIKKNLIIQLSQEDIATRTNVWYNQFKHMFGGDINDASTINQYFGTSKTV
jgi:hypothetical protein